MNKDVLNQKLDSLKRYGLFNDDLIEKFGKTITYLSDWDLRNINPIEFSKKYDFPLSKIIDLFILSARVGLFDIEWNMICPLCGQIIKSLDSFNQIKGDNFYCVTCNKVIENVLDTSIEVAFNINPGVHVLNLDPYTDRFTYYRYYFTENIIYPDELSYMFRDKIFRDFKVIMPDNSVEFTFEAEKNKKYRVITHDIDNVVIYISVGDNKNSLPQIIDIDLLNNGFSPEKVSIDSGQVTLKINSRLTKKIALSFENTDFSMTHRMVEENPPMFKPYFTGKMLLNNQIFRELFRIQNVPNDLALKVSNLTVLFTDLKGSTEIYDKIGDLSAYNLVQKHFEILTRSVKKYSGAIIKTMGDAIMASFSNSKEGIEAAIDMMNNIREVDYSLAEKSYNMGLKIGLHEGSALAVKANQNLDYFGQTINIAARVQGLANEGEIWITEKIYDNDSVKNDLENAGYKFDKKSALLKGVESPAIVYKCAQ